jgi:hypothetical protein
MKWFLFFNQKKRKGKIVSSNIVKIFFIENLIQIHRGGSQAMTNK